MWVEGGAIESVGGWLGWDIDALIDNAEIIDGLPFARLEDVLAFKLSYGRPKDIAHARLTEAHLRGGWPWPGHPNFLKPLQPEYREVAFCVVYGR